MDMAEVITQATVAAGKPDECDRITDFRELCRELGQRATQYASGKEAVRALVNVAAYAYASERMRVRLESIGDIE
ncbi:hypothetical protein [Streptomyces bluensis]|uniref:hypothetical protein n=1 Tax=Streptomyces bluensis TaxID=33897 RepID=UPI00331A6865